MRSSSQAAALELFSSFFSDGDLNKSSKGLIVLVEYLESPDKNYTALQHLNTSIIFIDDSLRRIASCFDRILIMRSSEFLIPT